MADRDLVARLMEQVGREALRKDGYRLLGQEPEEGCALSESLFPARFRKKPW